MHRLRLDLQNLATDLNRKNIGDLLGEGRVDIRQHPVIHQFLEKCGLLDSQRQREVLDAGGFFEGDLIW